MRASLLARLAVPALLAAAAGLGACGPRPERGQLQPRILTESLPPDTARLKPRIRTESLPPTRGGDVLKPRD